MTSPLFAILSERIAAHPEGRITFAEYMDCVLYTPEVGYYSRGANFGGAGGDFYTSSYVGADFGELIALQAVQMWQGLGCTELFTWVEMGAGSGLLAADFLNFIKYNHPDFYSSLTYVIVERSEILQQQQRERLQNYAQVRWSKLEDLVEITGCFFSNELVDAFPVHRFVIVSGELQEIYVTIDNQELKEIHGAPSTPQLFQYLEALDIEYSKLPDGYHSEINLAALAWLQQIAKALSKGYALTIDYGYTAARYYQPSRRTGTLLCYYNHTTNDNPYLHLGEQDITAHINFTALEVFGIQSGLRPLNFTPQALWLMSLGVGERLALLREDSTLSLGEGLKRYQALHALINTTGLGNFGVLLQGKGDLPPQSASSLGYPGR
jgi:SAM-dependent MidA family methyltransferase